MPSMRNLVWQFDKDPRVWCRPDETDAEYIARRERETFEDRILEKFNRIVNTHGREVQ